MDKPMCRLCGTRHGLGEPHKWPASDMATASKNVANKLARLRAVANKLAIPKEVANNDDVFYVYVIGRRYEGPWKIGITINPRWRIMSLQSGSPDLLVIHGVVSVRSRTLGEAIERIMHGEFSDVHSHGEWFNAELDDVLSFLKATAYWRGGTMCDATGFTQPGKRIRGGTSTYKYRDREKRRRYMREYMREVRTQQTGKK